MSRGSPDLLATRARYRIIIDRRRVSYGQEHCFPHCQLESRFFGCSKGDDDETKIEHALLVEEERECRRQACRLASEAVVYPEPELCPCTKRLKEAMTQPLQQN